MGIADRRVILLTCLVLGVVPNARADDLAYKKLPALNGQPPATMYFESGPTSGLGCPNSEPDSDTQNFWEGGRIVQGESTTRFCWFGKGRSQNKPVVVVLIPSTGKETTYPESDLIRYPSPPTKAKKPIVAESSNAKTFTKDQYCIIRSHVYMNAAERRDIGQSPQEAWQQLFASDDAWFPVQKEDRKYIINQVYFDPAFKQAHGQALQYQMMQLCLRGKKEYEPLK